jgi:hypothetical protein
MAEKEDGPRKEGKDRPENLGKKIFLRKASRILKAACSGDPNKISFAADTRMKDSRKPPVGG